METKSSKPCVLSLILGAVTYPLSNIAFFMYFAAGMSTEAYGSEAASRAQALFITICIAMNAIVAVLAVVSVVLGIIGIKQKRAKRGAAIAGIIISTIVIVIAVFTYVLWFFIIPSLWRS